MLFQTCMTRPLWNINENIVSVFNGKNFFYQNAPQKKESHEEMMTKFSFLGVQYK